MNTITEELLKGFTDEELRRLCAQIEAEEMRRRRANRSKLIEDFHKAWIALDDAQIYVRYGDEWDDGVYLSKWDKFEFGD